MKNIFKRVLSLSLAVLLVLGVFAGCGNSDKPADTTEVQTATQPPEEAKVLKILTLGHSLGNDCNHMLSLIAGAEGFTDLEVGYLYYSGCRLRAMYTACIAAAHPTPILPPKRPKMSQ